MRPASLNFQMFAAIFAAVVREGFPGINLVNYSYRLRYKYRYLPLYLMWHLKLPLNMEETSPNPLIQALLLKGRKLPLIHILP